ncbi:MAG: class I SAM-dependent methyltransferase [Lentisphaerae bacterium]|nr:class I SAM-dependent methyltransferase [Lentisphaerota bacterium]
MTPRRFLGGLKRRLKKLLLGREKPIDTLAYWERRSRQLGRRAVLNTAHAEEAFEQVTDFQIREMFPHLKQRLSLADKMVLDFGCGPGRFSEALALLVDGRTLAVDPVQHMLDMAPASDRVDYQRIVDGRLPAEDGSIDVVWICLVLGGILNQDIGASLNEIHRVLKPGGLICVAENTVEEEEGPAHWRSRTVGQYQEMISFCRLDLVHVYVDIDEEVSVMIGRKDK